MLSVHPDTICFIIAKAREFQAKEQVVIPDWALQVLADHIDDLSLLEVKTAVQDLSPEQQAELVALMWLGRGDYDMEDWYTAVEDAQHAQSDNTAQYLLAHPYVSDYLEEGLIQHGYSCEE